MAAVAELGRNPVNKHQIQPEYGDKQVDAGRGCRNPPREFKLLDANGYREKNIFIGIYTVATPNFVSNVMYQFNF